MATKTQLNKANRLGDKLSNSWARYFELENYSNRKEKNERTDLLKNINQIENDLYMYCQQIKLSNEEFESIKYLSDSQVEYEDYIS